MARRSGKTGTVTYDEDGVLAVTQFDIELQCDVEDVTGMDSGGVKEYIPTLVGFSGTIRGHWDGNGPPPREGSTAAAVLECSGDGPTITADTGTGGELIIQTVRPTVRVDGSVDFDCTVQGTGVVEVT